MSTLLPPERRAGLEWLASEVASIHRDNTRRDAELQELRSDVRELLALANQGRGGFWAGMTIASTLGAVAGWFFTHFSSTPR